MKIVLYDTVTKKRMRGFNALKSSMLEYIAVSIELVAHDIYSDIESLSEAIVTPDRIEKLTDRLVEAVEMIYNAIDIINSNNVDLMREKLAEFLAVKHITADMLPSNMAKSEACAKAKRVWWYGFDRSDEYGVYVCEY